MSTRDSIDLMNVDYDDVLHLYRGWRRSEGQLKEKNKELNALKQRITQLQDSHTKFRGQIQALESVKELTGVCQQENAYLVKENKEYAKLHSQSDAILREKIESEHKQSTVLKEIQIEFAHLRGRYDELSTSQKELEATADDEQAMRMAAESQLVTSEETIEAMRQENRALKHKLESTTMKMTQCDHELEHAAQQLGTLSREVSSIANTRDRLATAEAELGVIKGDISRLVRLLQHIPAAKQYSNKWIDSDGMSFVGIGSSQQGEGDCSFNKSVNKSSMSMSGHDAILFSHGLSQSALNEADLTQAEFSHMSRIHSCDPFPMTETMEDELNAWVPREAAQLGMNFLSTKMPHVPSSIVMDFMRGMNKVWLKRERRKFKRIKDQYEGMIGDLKRQLSNLRPYHGVIAEKQIRRLQSQVNLQRRKQLTGRAYNAFDDKAADLDDDNNFDVTDNYADDQHLTSGGRRLRPCEVMIHTRQDKRTASIESISQEKLLEASLKSLESLGRQQQLSNSTHSSPSKRGGGGATLGRSGADLSSCIANDPNGFHPTESYLRGALWLGRNLTMVMEELSEAAAVHRSKYLLEVASANEDTDWKRACHRLGLIAGTGANETLALINRSRSEVRSILQGAASLSPGDLEAYQSFMATLPIEAALTTSRSTKTTQQRSHSK